MKVLLISLLLVSFILMYRDTLTMNMIIFLTIQRGILTTNCRWWALSNLLTSDTTGVHLYTRLKQQHSPIYPFNIFGRTIHIVFAEPYIRTLLDESPFTYGVGSLKYNFFHSFMPLNVGVSQGEAWVRRRRLNEHVLTTAVDLNLPYSYTQTLPTTYTEFSILGRTMMERVVFGTDSTVPMDVLAIFKEANSLSALFSSHSPVSTCTYRKYRKYLSNAYHHPSPNSLVSYIQKDSLTTDEILDQIPHWMFPIMGLFSNIIPRVLLLVFTHRYVSLDPQVIRRCILETLRLNNPVNSTFRSALHEVYLDKPYPKNTQFLIINNPVLRDPTVFPHPNEFIPDRWLDPTLEHSYYALMFNQGPQICPGKDLVIQLATNYIQYYLTQLQGFQVHVSPIIDTKNIPQMINACEIEFSVQPYR